MAIDPVVAQADFERQQEAQVTSMVSRFIGPDGNLVDLNALDAECHVACTHLVVADGRPELHYYLAPVTHAEDQRS